jgi:hypothetical protein
MRTFLLFVITTLFISNAQCQDSTIALSKFEMFSNQAGKMFKNESQSIGKTVGTSIFKERTTDLATGETHSAIKIRQNKYSHYSTLYIDVDELDGVSKALDYYIQQMKKGKPNYAPVFYYTTSNDVVVSCSYDEGGLLGGGWDVNVHKIFHNTRYPVASSYVYLKNRELDDFIETIQKAKATTFD